MGDPGDRAGRNLRLRRIEVDDQRFAGRGSPHRGDGGAPRAHRRGSGEGLPDVRPDHHVPRGGGGHQGTGARPPFLPRRARHRRRRCRRPSGRHRERKGRGGRRGAGAVGGDRRPVGAAQARARPDGRAEPRLAAALSALDRARAVADGAGGGSAGQANRARRHGGEDPHGRGQPAPRRFDRQGLPGSWADVPGPDPGGLAGADPGGREVRLPARLQVLDLRDLVDPPGRDASDRGQGPDDPDPGPYGREAQQGRACRAPARADARP